MLSSRGVHGGGEGSTPAPILKNIDTVFKRGAWGRGGEYPSTYPACWVQEGCMGEGVPQYLPYMLSSRGVHGGRGVPQHLSCMLSSRGVHGGGEDPSTYPRCWVQEGCMGEGRGVPQYLSCMLSSRGVHGGGEGSTPAPILHAEFKRGARGGDYPSTYPIHAEFKRDAWGRGGEYPSTYPRCWVQEGVHGGREYPSPYPTCWVQEGCMGEGRGVPQYLHVPNKLSSRGVHGRRGVEFPQHLYMLSSRGLYGGGGGGGRRMPLHLFYRLFYPRYNILMSLSPPFCAQSSLRPRYLSKHDWISGIW